MFKDGKNQDSFYRVSVSDCQTVVLSQSFEDAAAQGLDKIMKKFKDNTNISFAIIVDKICEETIETEVFDTCKVLDDAGYFNLSSKMSILSDFLLDKRKKRS